MPAMMRGHEGKLTVFGPRSYILSHSSHLSKGQSSLLTNKPYELPQWNAESSQHKRHNAVHCIALCIQFSWGSSRWLRRTWSKQLLRSCLNSKKDGSIKCLLLEASFSSTFIYTSHQSPIIEVQQSLGSWEQSQDIWDWWLLDHLQHHQCLGNQWLHEHGCPPSWVILRFISTVLVFWVDSFLNWCRNAKKYYTKDKPGAASAEPKKLKNHAEKSKAKMEKKTKKNNKTKKGKWNANMAWLPLSLCWGSHGISHVNFAYHHLEAPFSCAHASGFSSQEWHQHVPVLINLCMPSKLCSTYCFTEQLFFLEGWLIQACGNARALWS